MIKNSASEQIKSKWINNKENGYTLRSTTNDDLKIPEKPNKGCMEFSYNGSKLFHSLPSSIKEAQNVNIFKVLIKNFILKNIPSC